MEPVYEDGRSRYDGKETPLEVLQRQPWTYRWAVKLDAFVASGPKFSLMVLIAIELVVLAFNGMHMPTKLEEARMRYQSEGLISAGEGRCEKPYALAPYTICQISLGNAQPHEWTCTAHGCFSRPE